MEEYNVICNTAEDIELYLDKFIKIELLDDTNSYFVGGKYMRFESIASFIEFKYVFLINDIPLDKLNLNYLNVLIGYSKNESYFNNESNIMYISLLPKPKYDWILETYKITSKQKDITNIKLEFNIKYINQDEFIKQRLGKFNLSIVSKIELFKLPPNITFCETINGNPMTVKIPITNHHQIYDERHGYNNKPESPESLEEIEHYYSKIKRYGKKLEKQLFHNSTKHKPK